MPPREAQDVSTTAPATCSAPAQTGCRRRRRWYGLVALLPLLYAGYAAFMYVNQDRILFPGTGRPHRKTAGPTEPGVEQVWITTADGTRVEAWYQPGVGCTPATPGPALIYFHGNYDLIDTSWWVAAQTCPAGISTLAVEYRGYGRAGGHPSEAGLVADAVQFYDGLAARPEVDRNRIVLRGMSLGGAVATALAAQRRPAALVLEATFSSVEAIAHRYLLPGYLCRNPFRTDAVLPTLHVPIAIYHGWRDRTIPVEHGRRLHTLVPDSHYTELDCGHDNFHSDWDSIRTFLVEAGVLQNP
jgi:fermentation-respiration switch protein FrsA (DUF1100 family)